MKDFLKNWGIPLLIAVCAIGFMIWAIGKGAERFERAQEFRTNCLKAGGTIWREDADANRTACLKVYTFLEVEPKR